MNYNFLEFLMYQSDISIELNDLVVNIYLDEDSLYFTFYSDEVIVNEITVNINYWVIDESTLNAEESHQLIMESLFKILDHDNLKYINNEIPKMPYKNLYGQLLDLFDKKYFMTEDLFLKDKNDNIKNIIKNYIFIKYNEFQNKITFHLLFISDKYTVPYVLELFKEGNYKIDIRSNYIPDDLKHEIDLDAKNNLDALLVSYL